MVDTHIYYINQFKTWLFSYLFPKICPLFVIACPWVMYQFSIMTSREINCPWTSETCFKNCIKRTSSKKCRRNRKKRIDICCMHSMKTEPCVFYEASFKQEDRRSLCVLSVWFFPLWGRIFSDNEASDTQHEIQLVTKS